MAPYETLTPGGKRIDPATADPERRLQDTREALAAIIIEAARD